MIDFTYKERELIYKSVQYYKEHFIGNNDNLKWDCDVVLQKFYPYVNINGIEPGFRSDT
jgi:hypothetical protein